jgi:hypothetical protein
LNRREQRKRRKNCTSLFAPFRQRSYCSPEGTTLSQPRRPSKLGAPANASSASVRATLGNVATEIHSPEGAALNCRRNERSPWQMIEPSFPPSLRATPSGFRCGHSSHPRVARTLVSLTCAPPWAGLGSSLRDCSKNADGTEQTEKCSSSSVFSVPSCSSLCLPRSKLVAG